MYARFALAWREKENNPELVKDEGRPRPRGVHEQEDAEREAAVVKPPGKPASMRVVFEEASKQRKMRKERRESSLKLKRRQGSSSEPRIKSALMALAGRAALRQARGSTASGQPDPYMQQYHFYTGQRDKMENEGFWDEGKTAEMQFGFLVDEKELARPGEDKVEGDKSGEESKSEDETAENSEDKSGQTSSENEAGDTTKKKKKTEKRVVISTVPTVSATIPDSEDTGIDTMSIGSSQTEITMDGKWRKQELMEEESDEGKSKKSAKDKEDEGGVRETTTPSGSATPSTTRGPNQSQPDLMSRFYARLQELQESKQEDDQITTTSIDTRARDRKRIKTALRRLLTERLFPEEAKTKKSKTLSKANLSSNASNDGFESGTITPLTLGSRTKTAMSIRSRFDGSTRATTGIGSQGRVMFVGERSDLTTAEVNDKTVSQEGQGSQEITHEEAKWEEEVPYYRRHPLGTLKNGKVSRLYQPPVMLNQRSRTCVSQSSLQHGLRHDKAFLQRLKGENGVRTETRWSVPGEYGPDRGRDNRLNSEHSSWRRERAEVGWTYNMAGGRQGDDVDPDQSNQPMARLNLKSLDDWHLRKLLEELYRDKKYMDRMIDTAEQDDKEEVEVSHKMSDGREYLLERALYWMEKGPLPPRPPTTDLGYRMQKMRAQTSSQVGGQTPLPPKTPVPASRQHFSRDNSTLSTNRKDNDSTRHKDKGADTNNSHASNGDQKEKSLHKDNDHQVKDDKTPASQTANEPVNNKVSDEDIKDNEKADIQQGQTECQTSGENTPKMMAQPVEASHNESSSIPDGQDVSKETDGQDAASPSLDTTTNVYGYAEGRSS